MTYFPLFYFDNKKIQGGYPSHSGNHQIDNCNYVKLFFVYNLVDQVHEKVEHKIA